MKALTILLVLVLSAACCTNQRSADEPGVLDKAADVVAPVAKGYLCSNDKPPVWSDSPAAVAIWTAARALACNSETPTPASVDADVELPSTP